MTIDIKICGLRAPDTMAAALDAGADFVGLVFFEASPRHVDWDEAGRLSAMARGRSRVVALTVNADDAALTTILQAAKPDMLQLHGSESPERVFDVRRRFAMPVMKAIKVATAEDASLARAYAEAADLILFDARPPKGARLPGGNGVAFDWRVLDGVKESVSFMLSGGLTPETVVDAIRTTGARAVDVSSGVESRPGVKDAALIRRFIAAARASDQDPAGSGHCSSADKGPHP